MASLLRAASQPIHSKKLLTALGKPARDVDPVDIFYSRRVIILLEVKPSLSKNSKTYHRNKVMYLCSFSNYEILSTREL